MGEKIIIGIIIWFTVVGIITLYVYSIGELNERYDNEYLQHQKIFLLNRCAENNDYALLHYLGNEMIFTGVKKSDIVYAQISLTVNESYQVTNNGEVIHYNDAEQFLKDWSFDDEDKS